MAAYAHQKAAGSRVSVSCGTVCRLPAVLLGGLPRCRPSAGRGADQPIGWVPAIGWKAERLRPTGTERTRPPGGRCQSGEGSAVGEGRYRAGPMSRGAGHAAAGFPAVACPCLKGVGATARPRPRCRRRTGTRRTRPRGGSWCAWCPRTRTQRARRRTARATRSRGCSSLHSQWARTARVRP